MFETDLVVRRDVKHNNSWVLQEPLVYSSSSETVTVMPGLVFDFASIPFLVRLFLPKEGRKYDRAVCLHDGLYRFHAFGFTKSNTLFFQAMKSDGVNKAVRWLFWAASQLFGYPRYLKGSPLDLVAGGKGVIISEQLNGGKGYAAE